MKHLVFIILCLVFMASCQQASVENVDTNKTEIPEVKDGVFIHISEGYNDAHRVLMPLKMAILMADDKDVLVYMDIHAVELLVKDAKDIEMEGFESAQTYLKQLVEKGIGVYVCPTCLKVAGFSTDDLIDGIQGAEKDKFFNFTQGRIITLDY